MADDMATRIVDALAYGEYSFTEQAEIIRDELAPLLAAVDQALRWPHAAGCLSIGSEPDLCDCWQTALRAAREGRP